MIPRRATTPRERRSCWASIARRSDVVEKLGYPLVEWRWPSPSNNPRRNARAVSADPVKTSVGMNAFGEDPLTHPRRSIHRTRSRDWNWMSTYPPPSPSVIWFGASPKMLCMRIRIRSMTSMSTVPTVMMKRPPELVQPSAMYNPRSSESSAFISEGTRIRVAFGCCGPRGDRDRSRPRCPPFTMTSQSPSLRSCASRQTISPASSTTAKAWLYVAPIRNPSSVSIE